MILIFLTNGAVLIVPGLNFAMLTRYVLQHGLLSGVLCTIGITLAISIHVIFSMLGSYQIVHSAPIIFKMVQILGSFYIAYLATKILLRIYKKNNYTGTKTSYDNPILNGFMIDLLNPFVTLFYFSLFSSLITEKSTVAHMSIYLIFILILTFFWFFSVSLLFSRQILRQQFIKYKNHIEFISGIVLYYYAIQLFFST